MSDQPSLRRELLELAEKLAKKIRIWQPIAARDDRYKPGVTLMEEQFRFAKEALEGGNVLAMIQAREEIRGHHQFTEDQAQDVR